MMKWHAFEFYGSVSLVTNWKLSVWISVQWILFFHKKTQLNCYVWLCRLGKPVSSITLAEREQTKRIVYSVMYGAGDIPKYFNFHVYVFRCVL